MAVSNLHYEQSQHNIHMEVQPVLKVTAVELSYTDPKKKQFNCVCMFGDTIFIGTRNSKLIILRFIPEEQRFSEEIETIIPHCEVISSIAATTKYFISVPESDDESVVSIWNNDKDKKFLTSLKGHKSQVSKVLFLKDNVHIATSSWDSTVKIWEIEHNLKNDEYKEQYYAGGYPILTMEEELNYDDVLVLGGDDCYLTFWNWQKNQVLQKVFGHAGSVTFITSFKPYLLTAGGDHKFKKLQLSPLDEGKFMAKTKDEVKIQYDAYLYSTPIGNGVDGKYFIIDRLGEMFLYNSDEEQTMKSIGCLFKYNENVTGLAKYGKFLFITTTKGALRAFRYDFVEKLMK